MYSFTPKHGAIHGNDGNTAYRTINGTTFFNTIDTEKPGRARSRSQRIASAILDLMNRYTLFHYADLNISFSKGKHHSPRHAFMRKNRQELKAALSSLAERVADGEMVTIAEIDTAVSDYATQNPNAIVIGSKTGYQPLYLSGAWPSTFTFLLNSSNVAHFEYQQPDGTYGEHGNDTDSGGSTGGAGGGGSSPNAGGSEQVTLSVVASPSNGGTVVVGTMAKGSQVTLSATPGSGYTFSRWSDGNTSAQRTVTASSSMTYTAQFAASQPSTGGGNGDD